MHVEEERAVRLSHLRNLNSITMDGLIIEHTLTTTTSIPRLSTYFLNSELKFYSDNCICRSPLQLTPS